MPHHVDIRLLPDPEMAGHQLMSALYSKLHRALSARQTGRIAVTFPGYSQDERTLGSTLRLIGPEPELTPMLALDWLGALRDHSQLSRLMPVPPLTAHRATRRVQAKSSPQRLQRRQMRRHSLTEEQARQRIPNEAAERLKLPFVTLRSASTGQPFPLFIAIGLPAAAPVDGSFNAYGLSLTATTPWF